MYPKTFCFWSRLISETKWFSHSFPCSLNTPSSAGLNKGLEYPRRPKVLVFQPQRLTFTIEGAESLQMSTEQLERTLPSRCSLQYFLCKVINSQLFNRKANWRQTIYKIIFGIHSYMVVLEKKFPSQWCICANRVFYRVGELEIQRHHGDTLTTFF